MKPKGTVKTLLLHLNRLENDDLIEITLARPERNLSDIVRAILREEVKRLRRAK